ncbi:MAG: SRPBCC family protein [Salibacteraceae bacterium]
MKTILKSLPILLLAQLAFASLQAQQKVQTIYIERIIALPAEQVWAIVGEDYGAIAHSHPRIVSSQYINGSLKAGEGAERVCNFNEKGTQYLRERIMSYSPESMTLTNQVFQAGKFPVDPELTKAVYKVEDLGNGTCKLSFDFQYRTKPAMMGSLMKGRFTSLLEDYFIAVEHHAKTGEKVNKENFKAIKKQYT